MPPNADKPKLSLYFKYPSKREGIKSGKEWLSGKREDDEAEELWRVHDNLYDVSDFIKSHPGGPSWLEMTKGIDITEAFEAHHLTSLPEEILKKYFVRKAKKPRNSPFTFKDDGFYRTLKRNIQPVLQTIPKDSGRTSDMIVDSLCFGTFLFGIIAAAFSSILCGIISAFMLTFTIISAHNYFHRRDNIRMYLFNLLLVDFKEWRISHSLSHHLLTNTIYDLEMSAWETFVQYLPVQKSIIYKCCSCVAAVILWFLICVISYKSKVIAMIEKKQIEFADLIPYTMPLAMYIFSGSTLWEVLKIWIFIVFVASFIFASIGFNAAHHHPDIFHEGDTPRSKKVDWGIHQLDTVCDRHEITGNTFLVLTFFGDHGLHHMFPTLDHTSLQYLYPVFKKTMKDFNVDLMMKSQFDMVVGQFQQLLNDTPNSLPPGAKKLPQNYKKNKG